MAQLDLLLVNPGGRELIYQNLGAELSAIEPPLWCRLIAGYAVDRGYSVEILDSEAENKGPETVAREVLERNPRLLGMVAFGHDPADGGRPSDSARHQGTESGAEDPHRGRARGGSPGTHDERRGDRFRLP